MHSWCDAVQCKDQHLSGTACERVREWVGKRRSLKWMCSIAIRRLAELHNLSLEWFCRLRLTGSTIKPLHVHLSLVTAAMRKRCILHGWMFSMNVVLLHRLYNLAWSVGPTVFRWPRNFEPSRGIWVFPRYLSRGINRGIRLFSAECREI